MKTKNLLWITFFLALVFMMPSCPEPELPGDKVLTGSIIIDPPGESFLGTKLTANYDGPEAVSYQWNRDGATYGGALSAEFTPTQIGSYTVTVSASGYISKDSAAVTIVEPGEHEDEDWDVELGDSLLVETGTEAGEIDYSFDATDPAADTYTLYYIEGDVNNAASIIATGTSVNTNGELSGTISGLENDTTYSFVVKAEKTGYKTINSIVAQATTIVVFSQLEKPVIELSEGTDKDNVLIGTKLTAVYNGEEDISFQWNDADGPIANQTNEEFTPTATGNYTVTVKAEGYLDNTSDVVTVILRTLSGNISISLPSGINAGNVFTTMPLTANYTGTETEVYFNWYSGLTEVATGPIFVPETAGTYTVMANREDYTSETSAAVDVKAFVPVSEITGYTSKIFIDEPSAIGGTVNAGASFTDIIWSMASDNANALAGIDEQDRLYAEGYGTITLTATVENGLEWELDFVHNYTVEVATFVVMNITMEDTDFGLVDIGKAIFNNAGTVLSASTPPVELLIADDTLTDINWYLGNITLAENKNSYTLNYAAFNNAGSYTLTVFFKDAEGRRWSGNYTFTVSNE